MQSQQAKAEVSDQKAPSP